MDASAATGASAAARLPWPAPPCGPPTRHRLLDHARQRPGACTAELARLAGVDHSTATYHLRRLHRDGVLVAAALRGRVHWFLAGGLLPGQRARLLAGRLPASRAILERLAALPPGVPLGAVAAGLPLSPAGVLWHLRRLEALGLVQAEGRPRARRYRIAAPADAAMAPQPVSLEA